jgi:DNA-binding response OmpR family regulator
MAIVAANHVLANNLLVVDDDQFQGDEIVRVAGDSGIENISRAGNESEAYQIIASQEFSLAVVDIMLSSVERREGLRVITELRRLQPDCRIIALTTRGRNDIGVQALNLGADDFVCGEWKYISWSELLRQRLDLWRGVARSREVVKPT